MICWSRCAEKLDVPLGDRSDGIREERQPGSVNQTRGIALRSCSAAWVMPPQDVLQEGGICVTVPATKLSHIEYSGVRFVQRVLASYPNSGVINGKQEKNAMLRSWVSIKSQMTVTVRIGVIL